MLSVGEAEILITFALFEMTNIQQGMSMWPKYSTFIGKKTVFAF